MVAHSMGATQGTSVHALASCVKVMKVQAKILSFLCVSGVKSLSFLFVSEISFLCASGIIELPVCKWKLF